MYLKALNIRGFKSFADKVSLRFSPGLSAVVGPNGSGKSNISDAVLWVLGERNAKKLRGSLMNDVIFAGSKTRAASSFAEVELVLDNSDHTLALDFNEVSIMRRLTRNGESSYFINGVLYRRCDIISLLHDTALGSGLNSVIAQGNLDAVLQSSVLERRVLIEEAAGILKIKQQNEKSSEKLARMDEHLAQVHTLSEEMKRTLAPLAKKAQRAKKALELRVSYNSLQFDLWADTLLGLNERIDAHNANLEKLAEDARQLQQAQSEHQNMVSDEHEKRAQFAKQEEHACAQEQRARAVHEKTQLLKNALDQRLRTYRDLHDTQLRMKEAYPHRFAELKCRLDTLCQQLASYQHSYEEQQEQQAEIRRQLHELREARTQRETQLAAKREQYKAAQQAQRTHQQELFQNTQRNSVLAEKIAALTARVAELNDECAALETEHEDLQSRSSQLDSRKESLQSAAQQARAAHEEALQAYRDVQAQVLDVQARYQAACQQHASLLKLKQQMLELNSAHTWFAERLQSAGDTAPLLIDTLKVPAHLENLVSVLLGDYVSAFTFDSFDNAQRSLHAVEQMKQRGCVSLLWGCSGETHQDDVVASGTKPGADLNAESQAKPLSAQPHADNAAPHTSSRYYDKLLIHQLDIPAAQSPHLTSLLGNVVLMPTFEQAYYAAQTCTESLCFATPACELAYSDGRVLVVRTQSSAAVAPSSSAHVHNEKQHHKQEDVNEEAREQAANLLTISRQLRVLASTIDAQREQLERARLQSDACKAQLDQCESASRAATQAALEHTATMQAHALQLKRVADALQKAREKHAYTQSLLEPLDQEFQATQNAREQLAQRLAQCEGDVKNFERDIAAFEREEEDARRERAKLQNNLNAVQVHSASMHERIQSTSLQRTQTATELEKLQREHAAYCQQEQRFQLRCSHTRAMQTLLSVLDETYHSIMEMLTQQKASIERNKSAFEQQFNQVLRARLAVQEQCAKLQELQTDQRVAIGKLEVEREGVLQALKKHGYEQPYCPSPYFDRDAAHARFQQLEAQLHQLGNVDEHSIAEYEAQKARLAELEAQVADIARAREHIQHIIDVLAKRIETQFRQAFDETARNFSDVISYLFHGAEARLQLISSNDAGENGAEKEPESDAESIGAKDAEKTSENAGGIEIYVSPRGKKISSLRLMSGGERSLCALAFIFAVYRVRNAPFFLLDEVEAALDDANLLRLIRYIDTLQRSSQVIMITHQRATMEHAQVLYGVSMRGDGVTRVLSQSIDEALETAAGNTRAQETAASRNAQDDSAGCAHSDADTGIRAARTTREVQTK